MCFQACRESLKACYTSDEIVNGVGTRSGRSLTIVWKLKNGVVSRIRSVTELASFSVDSVSASIALIYTRSEHSSDSDYASDTSVTSVIQPLRVAQVVNL